MANWLHKQRISQFCCSCTVRTGTLIIGILEVLGALFQIIFLFVNIDIENVQLSGDTLYASQIASCVLSFIVGLTLLWAVHNRSKDFLVPYLVLRTISWFLLNFAIGAFIVIVFVFQLYILLLIVAAFIIASALISYFWRCVLSFYFELAEERNTSRPNV